MDAAAREMKLDPAELRRRNMIRPEQMPYTNADGPDLRQRPVREDPRPGPGARRLERLRARAATSRRSAASCAAAASPPSSNGPAAWPSRRRSPWTSRPTASSRSLGATQAMGQGIADQLRAARGRRVRRADRADPHRPGRHRPRQRLRQRRLALALHRRLGGAGGLASARSSQAQAAGRRGARGRRRATSSTAPARFTVVGTDLGIGLFELAGKQSRPRIVRRSRPARCGADLAERLPRLRGRDRSRDRRGRGRRLRVGQRHRPRRQPDDRARPGRRRRGAGHRPGAVRADGLRPRAGPAADRQLHGLRAAARRHGSSASGPSSTPRCPA